MTKHFTFDELTDSANHPELVPQNQKDALRFLKQLNYTANSLEEIRAIINVPMKVTSGFRNPALNKAVGSSSPTSGHTKGLCADFKPIGMDIDTAFGIIIRDKIKLPSLKKAIMEKIGGAKWIHIETKTEAHQPTQFFTTSNGKIYNEVKA